jgi:hypothetical protein
MNNRLMREAPDEVVYFMKDLSLYFLYSKKLCVLVVGAVFGVIDVSLIF